MKTKVYEIQDQDVLELFFGEDQKYSPIYMIASNHGDLIWDGNLSIHPETGDVLYLDGADKGVNEYMVICKAYHGDTNSCIMIVHNRYHAEGGLS